MVLSQWSYAIFIMIQKPTVDDENTAECPDCGDLTILPFLLLRILSYGQHISLDSSKKLAAVNVDMVEAVEALWEVGHLPKKEIT